ncbi:hypothetical protein COT48_02240 [Candidatus Woesearchaeota archaeon CG08_land_8_20_14_0_20_47_9]|nr:MAG: hypothetical protein COT48_02240 [Candidatus Woesearchaeota archaeon CG08_land_8_20_14_0_20_47_9]
MKTELKILRHLIEHKKHLTVRQLSKNIGSDYKISHTAIQRLIKKELLTAETVGKAKVVRLTNKFTKDVFDVEFERRMEILNNKNLDVAIKTIKENVACVNFIILLFGSYAKHKQRKHSDIDIMFIIPDKSLEKKIKEAISLIPLKLHPLILTEEEFVNMKNTTQPNVVHEVMENNVILSGIEQYYELIK